MKRKKDFKINKMSILLVCVILTFALLTGCSAGTPNDNRIKNDLNASDIIGSKEFFGKNDPQMVPVTKVSIVDKVIEGDECEIKCNVVFQDDNYKIDAQVTAFYSKFDKWSFDNYDIGDYTISPISGVSNHIIKQRAEYVANSSVGNLVENAQVTNIVHNFDANSKTDFVTFDLYAKGYTCQMNIKVSTEYSFENAWRVTKSDEEITNHEWLFNDLVGTEWSGSVGIGATRHIVINSVDTANKTMNVSYYSSQDDCSYEITDWYDDKAIKVHLPNESFTDQMWIFEDGEIRYGVPGGLGGMLGKRVDKTSKMDVIIDGVEETSGSYNVDQPIPSEDKKIPIVPIVFLVIVVIAIIIVIAKKTSKKTIPSKPVISPDDDDETIKSLDGPEVDLYSDKDDTIPELGNDGKSRIRKTIVTSSEDSETSKSGSDEEKGNWFKSAGDLE